MDNRPVSKSWTLCRVRHNIEVEVDSYALKGLKRLESVVMSETSVGIDKRFTNDVRSEPQFESHSTTGQLSSERPFFVCLLFGNVQTLFDVL